MWNQWKLFLREWQKTSVLTYIWAQNGPKIGPLRPIFHTSQKVLAISMWSNTDVKTVKTFDSENVLTKCPKFRILTHFRVQSGPKMCAVGAHIVHIFESSSNEHIKQDWCESRGNFITKYSKTWNLTHLKAPNRPQNLGLWGLSFTHIQKWLKPAYKSSFVWIQWKLFKKIDENLYIDLFGPYLEPKRPANLDHRGPFFTHTWKYLHCAFKRSCMILYQNLFEKMAKNLWNSHFCVFF